MAGRAAPVPGALLCALLWAAAAAAGGGSGDNPAPGAFGHVYRGAVNISAERVYAFAYRSEPGQVGATPGAPGSPRCGEHRVPLTLSGRERVPGRCRRRCGCAGAGRALPVSCPHPPAAAVVGSRSAPAGSFPASPARTGLPGAAGWEGAGVPGAAG